MPAIIENIKPLSLESLGLPDRPNEEFEYNFLRQIFGGSTVSNGHFKIPTFRHERLFPNLDSYRILNSCHEPLLPRRPGSHGAQISCVLEISQDTGYFPLFIRNASGGYRYFGNYREPVSDVRVANYFLLRTHS